LVVQHCRTLVYEEFLASALQQVVSLKGTQTLTLETRSLVLVKSILEATVASQTFDLPTLE